MRTTGRFLICAFLKALLLTSAQLTHLNPLTRPVGKLSSILPGQKYRGKKCRLRNPAPPSLGIWQKSEAVKFCILPPTQTAGPDDGRCNFPPLWKMPSSWQCIDKDWGSEENNAGARSPLLKSWE